MQAHRFLLAVVLVGLTLGGCDVPIDQRAESVATDEPSSPSALTVVDDAEIGGEVVEVQRLLTDGRTVTCLVWQWSRHVSGSSLDCDWASAAPAAAATAPAAVEPAP